MSEPAPKFSITSHTAMSAKPSAPLKEYGFAVVVAGASTAIAFAIFPHLELTNLVMLYLLGTLAVAARGRRGPAALSSVLSVLCFDFFFVPPRFSFTVSDAHYIVTFAVMFTVTMTMSHLTVRLRTEAEAVRESERRTALMHAFTQQLANARSLEKVLGAAVNHVEAVFHGVVIAFVPDEGGRLEAKAQSSGARSLNDKEHGVAQWVYDSGKPAGLGTGSLPVAEALYVPLQGSERTVGVLKVEPYDREELITPDQRLLLDSFAHQIGLALEVDRLQENAKKAEVEMESERLRSSLLSSVSHDFRTPLAAILGSADALLEKEDLRKLRPVRELLLNIQAEAERLSRLVQNLLEVTRLESGAVRLRKELYPLEEVIGSALERLEKALRQRTVKIEVPQDLPPVPMDAILVEQVFINLLENAVRHTPFERRVEISARVEGGSILVAVADEGAGLKDNELERVFEKFYHGASSPGAGLGLAICRAVVSAHGGRIWAENRPGRGAAFYFTLPLEKP
jgi:two-component system sensor histidine kinase KdpD